MSFLLLEINLLLKFDFLLKYEAYSIKWTSDTWSFAGLYLPCGSFQRLRWSTAVWCRWRNLKPVHVIRKILWKTESVMIGKIVTFWRVKMQIWVIYGWLCWGLTSQSTIFQSCRDGAIASWVINQYFRGVKCLAQGHNTAEVGLEPRTSRSGVRHSTTEPPRSVFY